MTLSRRGFIFGTASFVVSTALPPAPSMERRVIVTPHFKIKYPHIRHVSNPHNPASYACKLFVHPTQFDAFTEHGIDARNFVVLKPIPARTWTDEAASAPVAPRLQSRVASVASPTPQLPLFEVRGRPTPMVRKLRDSVSSLSLAVAVKRPIC